jgi:dTDP-4-amino-4,6-dideoxygalactose transaminase
MLPVTEEVAGRVIALPTGTAVDTEQISAICEAIRFIIANGSEVIERFSAKK